MILDQLNVPIVLAPLAGGPTTPRLAAAVSEAGGLGFLAAGYLTADALGDRIAQARALTRAPLGVNVFVPGGSPPTRRSSPITPRRSRRTRARRASRSARRGSRTTTGRRSSPC